jgi:short-chain Z-isoprenyl diphosphate synthase
MPRHIGIILDGNRRYGRQQGLSSPRDIYAIGARKLDNVLDWCRELRIPTVTLWVFSADNLNRPAEEVSGILSAVEAKLSARVQDQQTHRQRIRVTAIGRLDLLPATTTAAIRAAETATAQYDGMNLTIAIGYGGREGIVDASCTTHGKGEAGRNTT